MSAYYPSFAIYNSKIARQGRNTPLSERQSVILVPDLVAFAPMSFPKFKTLALIIAPILIAGFIVTTINVWHTTSEMESRATAYGNAMADQLALTVTDSLMQDDLLSLNVLVSELLADGHFSFASVYSADNRLLAQAGKNDGSLTMFTKDVVFQNASVGYVQLGMDFSDITAPARAVIATSIAVHVAIIGFIGLIVWFYGDFLYFWLSAPRHHTSQTPDAPLDGEARETPFTVEDVAGDITLLVIKVRPTRQLDANLERITGAISLYSGNVEVTEGEDIIVTFTSNEQVFEAACCGFLVLDIMALTRGNKQVKLGVHVASPADGDDVAKARKHASYLASISEGKLLASRKAHNKAGSSDKMNLTEFHSSLTPDGEVYVVDSISSENRELIERQSRRFI